MTAAPDVDRDWWRQALCAQIAPEMWFPEPGNQTAAAAKRVCVRCPVRQPCLRWALPRPLLQGVWGGMSVKERRREAARLGIVPVEDGRTLGEARRLRDGVRPPDVDVFGQLRMCKAGLHPMVGDNLYRPPGNPQAVTCLTCKRAHIARDKDKAAARRHRTAQQPAAPEPIPDAATAPRPQPRASSPVRPSGLPDSTVSGRSPSQTPPVLEGPAARLPARDMRTLTALLDRHGATTVAAAMKRDPHLSGALMKLDTDDLPDRPAAPVALDPHALTAVRTLREARQARVRWERLERQARELLVETLGDRDADGVDDSGIPQVRLRWTPRQTVDIPKLRAELPQIADRYTRVSEFPRLTIPDAGDPS